MPRGRRRCTALEGLARVGAGLRPSRRGPGSRAAARAGAARPGGAPGAESVAPSASGRVRGGDLGAGALAPDRAHGDAGARAPRRAGPSGGPGRSRGRTPAPQGRGRAGDGGLPGPPLERRAAPHRGRPGRAGPDGRGRWPPARGPSPVHLVDQGRSWRTVRLGGPGPARPGRRPANGRPPHGGRPVGRAGVLARPPARGVGC